MISGAWTIPATAALAGLLLTAALPAQAQHPGPRGGWHPSHGGWHHPPPRHHYRGDAGAALAAGLLSGLVLGAIVSAPPAEIYARPQDEHPHDGTDQAEDDDCWIEHRRVITPSGQRRWRDIEVCR